MLLEKAIRREFVAAYNDVKASQEPSLKGIKSNFQRWFYPIGWRRRALDIVYWTAVSYYAVTGAENTSSRFYEPTRDQ